MVKSAKAAERVMASLIRFAEDKLKLVVNRAKSQTAPLKACAFLSFQIGARGKVKWTAKALARFKQRVREITARNRGQKAADVINETVALCHRLAQLLRHQPHLQGGA